MSCFTSIMTPSFTACVWSCGNILSPHWLDAEPHATSGFQHFDAAFCCFALCLMGLLTCQGCWCRGSPNELKGCINDAHCMKYLLTTRLGFREADIVMLTDDQNNPQAWPTRANMVCLDPSAF